jgi:hypothetical protein
LVDSIARHELKCDWMSIKYDVEIKTPKLDDSFKLYIRLKQDSVIWVSATYYAVEIARFLFTPDTVKYMDRRNSKFYIGIYDYISNQFLVDANFGILQSIILANGSEFINLEDEKIRNGKDKGRYFLSFLRKRKLKRATKKDELKKDMDIVVSLWVDPVSFRITKSALQDFDENRSLIATYSDFMPHCNSHLPYSMTVIATASNEQSTVKTSISKVSMDKEVTLSFTIPEKYEPLTP